MSRLKAYAKTLLADPALFSNLVINRPLRGYQLEPFRAILNSVLNQQGLEFMLIFPRQSGKNETVAQLLVYLLNLYQFQGGSIIYGAIGDALGMAENRLAQALDNLWNAGKWKRHGEPDRLSLGAADVIFLSSHPQARSRGHTAQLLLVIDEAQDQLGSHIEAVFTPMRAAYNATAVYLGTVKTTTDFLWHKKLELEREQARDGRHRIWLTPPELIVQENPGYAAFLQTQVRRYGRHHPIVASEYYLEPIDSANAGLFPARRRALMRGTHPQEHSPAPGHIYLATLDVAGQDEATTDPIARLDHPARDYTVATVFDVVYPPEESTAPGPDYRAVDILVDHGSRHFESQPPSAIGGQPPIPAEAGTIGGPPGKPAMAQQLLTWLNHWEIAHLVADCSGVGEGLVNWIRAAMGERRVTAYQFAAAGHKAALGSRFVSLIETARFHYWIDDADQPGSDGWWFWRQVEACAYELPPEGRFDHDLRWGVHPSHRTDTPAGPQLTHDDRLLSAALVAEADRLLSAGAIILSPARSAVIPGRDPLAGLKFEGSIEP